MSLPRSKLKPVYVVGIGLHRYQKPSKGSYVELGLAAIREALSDAGISWQTVESAYIANTLLGMAPGRPMLRHLGATGLSLTHVENASASGSTAVRQACLEVAAGINDVVLAMGIDKIGTAPFNLSWDGTAALTRLLPVAHFALLTNEYMHRYGITAEEVAAVAVKNHGNAARNPYAHFQKKRTLEEVMQKPIAGSLTRLQCCPIGEGAAAVIVASEEAINRLGINPQRAVQVTASVSKSERLYKPEQSMIVELTRETAGQAFEEAAIGPENLDILEVHDAFSVEELLYTEAMGLCPEGQGAAYLAEGKSRIGGQCAISPSGGLLAMGHPFGPTGAGQVVEVTRQLRGEAGPRQQPQAKTGLAHMVGMGQVCFIHILQRAAS